MRWATGSRNICTITMRLSHCRYITTKRNWAARPDRPTHLTFRTAEAGLLSGPHLSTSARCPASKSRFLQSPDSRASSQLAAVRVGAALGPARCGDWALSALLLELHPTAHGTSCKRINGHVSTRHSHSLSAAAQTMKHFSPSLRYRQPGHFVSQQVLGLPARGL